MLSGSAVLSSLAFYDITYWCGCWWNGGVLYLWVGFAWWYKKNILTWVEFWKCFSIVCSVVILFLNWVLGGEIIVYISKVNWLWWLFWGILCFLWRVSLGKGIGGPIGVDWSLSSVSSDIPVVLAVTSAVFILLTCHSMKPLNFGHKGNDVICWICWTAMNLAELSEVNDGPFPVNNDLSGPYCKISCWNFACMVLVALEEALWMQRYLLNGTHMRCSLLWKVKSVVRSCHGPLRMPQGIMDCASCVALCWVHMVHLLT